jgi:hypothetical protein
MEQKMKVYKRWKNLSLKLNIRPSKRQSIKQKNKYAILFFVLSIFVYHSSYAATNTGLYGDDKYAGPFPIGFSFNYYGSNFDKFYVTTNGLIQFTNPSFAYTNGCLPDLKNTLYVFWDDLRTDVSGQPTGTIQYETQGEAPNRRLIVQWTNQYYFGNNLPMGTFQAILYENSNQIKYQYRYLIGEHSKGSGATIGIQGAASNYTQIGCNTANVIKPEQAILFTPNSDFSKYIVDQNASYNFFDISGLTSDAPIPVSRYSHQAPSWSWQKISTLNSYEIDIQDPSGNTVYREVVGDVGQFTFVNNLQNGQSYRARIRGSINNGGTWEMWSPLSTLVTIDTIKPVVKLKQFNRINSDTVKVIFSTYDNLSGVKSGHLQIATNQRFDTPLIDQDIQIDANSYQISNLPVKDNEVLYARLNVTDKAGNESGYTEPLAIGVTAPILIQPVSNSTVKISNLNVQGKAEEAGKVQLYLNGRVVNDPVTVDKNGYFYQVVDLKAEGNYQLTAVLNNDFGISEHSKPVSVSFKLPTPKATIITPADNQVIFAPMDIQISATDELGIDKVEVYLDDQLFSTLTKSPYQVHWPLTQQNNGKHKLTVKAINSSGKVVTIEREVMVKMEPPAPPPTAYTGKVTNINPKVSYGLQPITITGQAIYRKDNTVVANAPVKLVLKVNGFERKIAIATDDKGNFSYTFMPQENDAGIYQVAIIHPDELIMTSQASFEINRIAFNYQNYHLKAARNVAMPINMVAKASITAKNLRWVLTADNQPDGILPKGIQIKSEPIDINSGETELTMINFIADDTATEKGSIYLVALADESNDLIRGKLKIDYQLGQAMPTLYAVPNYIQTGVQQGTMVSTNIHLGNKGLAKAENVQIELLDESGNPAPNWIFIATDKTIESIAVDEQLPLQIVAQPNNKVSDGVYRFNLKIAENNNILGSIPVSISVTQSGLGIAQFDIADIYTATLDKQGNPIAGVKGATIKLQNEAVLTQQYSIISNEQGIALLENLPTGVYRYRVSAPNHTDVSGRIVIRPNTTINEHIFLEYQNINIEFGTTETAIKDVYDIELNATFNTLVPAPVVLIEPMSINLAGLQIGEEKVGELTITNYGLIEAKNVVLNLPKTDNKFKYEFFGEIPNSLLPKEKRVIAYRVTALDPNQTQSVKPEATVETMLFKSKNAASSCYLAPYLELHDSICANGDISKGNSGGYFYQYVGQCSLADFNWDWGSGTNSGSALGSPLAMPIAPGCAPEASCASAGTASGAR